MEKERRFTLKAESGCRRLMALFLIIIFVSLFFARFVTVQGGEIKNEQITIDARGAQLSAELYYPAGASDDDSYPAVVLCHGGGVNYNCMRPMALELARRGFVVLNMNFYGSGLSEMPLYDEGGQALADNYDESITPGGQIDAIRYLQNISFVDETRIGLAGHSAGGVRAVATAKTDGTYYSLNDLLINILYDEFSQEFTEEEIYQDAYELAKARLNEDQYKLFEVLAAKQEAYFNTRVRTAVSIGTVRALPVETVSVAGHEVSRTLKVNWFCCWGEYQKNAAASLSKEEYMAAFYATDAIERDTFYILDDENGSSVKSGDLSTRSDAITAAADNRRMTGYGFARETHSQNFLSTNTNANIINIMEATLKNNSGMDPYSQVWPVRIALTTISMLAMLALAFPVIGLLSKKKFFQPCVGTVEESKLPRFNKAVYWAMAVVSVAAAIWGVWKAQLASPFVTFLPNLFQQYFVGQVQARVFIHWTGLFAAITFAIFVFVNYKKDGKSGLACINNGVGVSGVFKSLLMGLIYLLFAFTLALIMNYLFHEEFRFWNVYFGVMNVEDWFTAFPYWLDLFLFYAAISASVNYSKRYDIPEWKDTLITVLINSVGVFLIFAFSRIHNATAFNVKQIIDFDSIYGLLLLAPVTTYITRKMYNVTKNIWTGAMVNACLIAWHFGSGGYHSITYHAQNWISTFFGL